MGPLGCLRPGARVRRVRQLGRRQVQLATTGRGERLVDRVPDQRVGEVEPVAVLGDQPGVDQLVDEPGQLRGRRAEQGAPAGSPTTTPPAPRRRRVRASAGWASRATRRRMVAWADSGSTEATEPAPRAARVAPSPRRTAGCPRCARWTARGSRPRPGVAAGRQLEQRAHVVARAARRSSHDSPRAAIWAASSRCRTGASRRGPAIRRPPAPPATQVGGQELQQPQRSLVDPVHVVEQEYDGPLAGQVLEHAVHRVEQREPSRDVGAAPRAVPSSNGTRQPRHDRPTAPEGVRRPRPAAPGTRPRTTACRGPPSRCRAARAALGPGRDLGEHARLADARVAVDPEQAAAPRATVRQQRVGPGEDVVTTEQWLAVHGGTPR